MFLLLHHHHLIHFQNKHFSSFYTVFLFYFTPKKAFRKKKILCCKIQMSLWKCSFASILIILMKHLIYFVYRSHFTRIYTLSDICKLWICNVWRYEFQVKVGPLGNTNCQTTHTGLTFVNKFLYYKIWRDMHTSSLNWYWMSAQMFLSGINGQKVDAECSQELVLLSNMWYIRFWNVASPGLIGLHPSWN